MSESKVWEYAWYEVSPGLSQVVSFCKHEDPGFESAARAWLTTAFVAVDRRYPAIDLRLHPQTPPLLALSFMGSLGWELVTATWSATGDGGRYIFKRHGP